MITLHVCAGFVQGQARNRLNLSQVQKCRECRECREIRALRARVGRARAHSFQIPFTAVTPCTFSRQLNLFCSFLSFIFAITLTSLLCKEVKK
jgi:hypothetical protein